MLRYHIDASHCQRVQLLSDFLQNIYVLNELQDNIYYIILMTLFILKEIVTKIKSSCMRDRQTLEKVHWLIVSNLRSLVEKSFNILNRWNSSYKSIKMLWGQISNTEWHAIFCLHFYHYWQVVALANSRFIWSKERSDHYC